jgi:hypothetical protein
MKRPREWRVQSERAFPTNLERHRSVDLRAGRMKDRMFVTPKVTATIEPSNGSI